MFSSYDLFSLHFGFLHWLAGLNVKGSFKEGVEVSESKLGVEDASVQVKVDGFAVLENIGF